MTLPTKDSFLYLFQMKKGLSTHTVALPENRDTKWGVWKSMTSKTKTSKAKT